MVQNLKATLTPSKCYYNSAKADATRLRRHSRHLSNIIAMPAALVHTHHHHLLLLSL